MPRRIPTPEGAVLRHFRLRQGVRREELARRAGVAPDTVDRWENGYVRLDRERLIEILALLEVPPEAGDAALFADRLASPPGASGPGRRLVEQAAAAGGWAAAKAARTGLDLEILRRQAPAHRRWAEETWSRIRGRPGAGEQERIVAVLEGDDRSWALAVRICAASGTAAAHRADEALRLARLALRLAREIPGNDDFRWLLLGYCEPFLANAFRVAGNLTAAREVFARADRSWRQGAAVDPSGLLDATRRLDLKASLLRQDGKFAEALDLLDQALAGSPPEAAARLLIMKATTYSRAGDHELSLKALDQAEPLVDARREPRQPFLLQFTRASNYCDLDRYSDAEPLLPQVEALAADLRTELDEARTLWLKGRIQAGLGRREEALAALSRVRRYLLARRIAYDFALITTELATLHLEQGRTRLAKELAEEMLWIFDGQRVHREALAALALFCQAAREEKAGAEWTRRLVKYLYRARHDPRLRFEP